MAISVKVDLTPDISGLQAKIDKVVLKSTVKPQFDTNELKNSLKTAIEGIKIAPIKLRVDQKYIQSQITGALKNISLEIEKSSKRTSTAAQSQVSSVASSKSNRPITYSDAKLEQTANSIGKIENRLKSAGVQGEDLAARMEKVHAAFAKVNAENKAGSIAPESIAALREETNVAKQAAEAEETLASARSKANRAYADYKKVQNEIVAGNINPSDSLKTAMKDIEELQQKTPKTSDLSQLEIFQRAGKAGDALQEALSVDRSVAKNSKAVLQMDTNLKNLLSTALRFKQANPKLKDTDTGASLDNLIARIQQLDVSAPNATNELAGIKAEAEKLGLVSDTLGSRLKKLFTDHFNTAIAMAALHLLQNSMTELYKNVVDVDTAMTNLRKVSDATDTQYASFLDGAGERAKALGTTITGVIDATSEFSRLGYNLRDSTVLGEAAVKYMNVSEYTNVEEAAQSLISTMKAFDIEASDVGSITDKFNEVGRLLPLIYYIGQRMGTSKTEERHSILPST